ncbi:hypothetical protein [Candidatus Villigracilis saccharophilus]|uniref:hypothetical protein n=1 Tax=Candidatus Villigracilis saccharophilus TaxID=3140684 RepID=UPI003135CA77|nr:hypothetical protein [Anaerolineales bacterium]
MDRRFSVPVIGHGDAGMVFDLRPGMGSGEYEFDADERFYKRFLEHPQSLFQCSGKQRTDRGLGMEHWQHSDREYLFFWH